MARPRIGSDNLTIAQLEALLEKRRSKVGKFERQRAKLQKKLEALDAKIASMGGSAGAVGGHRGRAKNDKSLPECIVEVLTAHGKPMKVTEVSDAVLKMGYKTNSPKFRGIVNQSLIKDKRFHAASRGFYQLKK
jgi:hypothetical protein